MSLVVDRFLTTGLLASALAIAAAVVGEPIRDAFSYVTNEPVGCGVDGDGKTIVITARGDVRLAPGLNVGNYACSASGGYILPFDPDAWAKGQRVASVSPRPNP